MSQFNNEELKVIIIMMKRASCTGEESGAVASVITKAEATYRSQEPVVEVEAPADDEAEVDDPVEEEDEQE